VEEMLTISRLEYEGMKREISELRMLVQQSRDENSLLKGGKDSRTSSTAPSHDPGRSNRISLRVSSGRKSGGQPGHRGSSTLSMSDTPDETIDHYPCVCEQCGEDLQGVKSASFSRRQLVDIPPVMPVYPEHRSHIKICPLCHYENRGSFPEVLQAPVQYGVRIEATAGYLPVYQGLPYKRNSQLFRDLFGIRLSEGSVDTFLERLAQKSNPVYENIREQIVESAVVCADETGCRVNGKKHWFHVWQTAVLTFIVSFAHRGYAVIEKYFADGFPVSFYASQFQNVDGKGADRYAKIRSVIDTTFKNEQDVYSTLVCLAKCRIVEVPE